MDNATVNGQKFLIASITPYFLQRDIFWFQENHDKIKKAALNQIWWKENTLFLEKDLQINLFALLRQLTEMGYEKVQTLGAPGDFAHRGGLVDIFPINSKNGWRLEFSGNKIVTIAVLPVKIIKKEKEIKKALAARQPSSLLPGLKTGDFLVHLDHGIGVFLGFAQQAGGTISTQTPDEKSLDKFFVLEYGKKDRLYVPLALEEKLSRYIGFEMPLVHRLGGTLWFKTKRRAKENALALAKELLALYGQRAAARGFQYPSDNEWQKEMENDFPYIETKDQTQAINQVKKDMESERPMDRLICGDVGFGKTEVALRAAFKTVNGGAQTAMLAPTTILANQHFAAFLARLKKFPIQLALLTRLQSKNKQKKIIEETAQGQIDILIGTHRLLSKDIIFKNLGLAIIDEEQKFGVKQKERFKQWKQNIDILSLTATPIPRTLHLALSGLRDISIINTPPPGRLPTKNFIEPFGQKIIKEAVARELARGGQVYYLHNRVETIELAAKAIKKLSPCANVAFIHGRMSEKQLTKIMENFSTGKINILVATTIIENGLDFPNVNTLIVANATRLGLAQAYQLRGRVGRSYQQAFAYFLYNAKHLTSDAKARLDALKEAEALGSGYQIALRDLEIRGAGNVLGREQSGPINAVGLNLYMQILNESIEELKNNF